VVASLLPTMDAEREHNCTTAAATATTIVRTVAVDTVGDCPSAIVEVDTTVL
jgi:hypothetical protein